MRSRTRSIILILGLALVILPLRSQEQPPISIEKVAAAIQAGESREEAMESVDLSGYADIQDMGEFLTKKNNVGWVYDEMSKQK